MKTSEIIQLFDEMYSAQSLRDSAFACASSHINSNTERAKKAYDAFTGRAMLYNEARNRAMLQLSDAGFFAFRDEDNHWIPTLMKDRRVIAYWHGFGEVELVG